MKALLLALLRWFWPSVAAALEAYWRQEKEEVDAQVQEILAHEEQIDAAAEAGKVDVDSMSESDLDVGLRE